MIPAVVRALADDEVLTREIPTLRLDMSRAVKLSGARGYHGKATFFLLDAGGVPEAVMKVARSPSAGWSLRREHWALRYARRRSPSGTRLPREYFVGRIDGHWVCVQEAMSGVPMATLLREQPSAAQDAAERAVHWIGAWTKTTERDTGRGPRAAAGRRRVLTQLSRLEQNVPWSPHEKSALRDLTDAWLTCEGRTCCLHGDYWYGNLLIDGEGTLGVLDWEFAQSDGPLFYDLFFFLVSLLAFQWSTSYSQAVLKLIGGERDAWRDFAANALTAHARALRVPADALGVNIAVAVALLVERDRAARWKDAEAGYIDAYHFEPSASGASFEEELRSGYKYLPALSEILRAGWRCCGRWL